MKKFIRDNLSGLFARDDRSVSPVISVILMVAITVILAAVIATFVLGIGESTNSEAPSTAFAFEYNGDTNNVLVTHAEGEIVNGDQLRFAGAALEKTSFGGIAEWVSGDGDVRGGEEAEVKVEAGETLQVVWQNEEATDTVILGEYDVPEFVRGSITSISADASADQVIYQMGSINEGSAELVVENTDTGDTNSTSVSSSESGTIGLNINDGDTVQATLYETSSQNNELITSSDTAASGTITDIYTGNNDGSYITRCEGDVEVTSTFSDTNEVYITAESETNPDDHKDSTTLSTSGNTVTLSLDPGAGFDSGDNDVIVKIWETNSENNKLDKNSQTATVGQSCP